LAELAERRRSRDPHAEFLVDGDIRLTVAEFVSRAQSIAGGLLDLGVGSGDVVSWELPSWWEAAALAVAIDWIGAVGNPIIPIYREREVGFIARQAASRVLVVPGVFRGFDYRNLARAVQSDSEHLQHLIVVRDDPAAGQLPFDELLRGSRVPERCDHPPHDVAMLFYTSGTTADPKGVMHTTSTIGAYARSSVDTMNTGPDDVGLLQFPLTHIGGLVAFVAVPLLAESRVVYLDTWEPQRALDLIAAERVTSAGGPPVILQGLMAAPNFSPDKVKTVRSAGTGAAGIPPLLVREVCEKFDASCFRAYGLTECPMLTTGVRADPEHKRMHTDGRPSPGCRVRIVDGDGRELPPGNEGEIHAFGPQLCVGYLDAELNREAFTPDGYLRTGDLGVVDEEGYVRVTGRVKDIIIRKGENLSAKAIEDVLAAHPDIADVAVIGLPDPTSGELACAVVVARARASSPALTLAGVERYMTELKVMRQMIPERLEVVESLPRNATGKIMKFELQRRFREAG
jgi:cyclohexanecarboxylate-CoA ligase